MAPFALALALPLLGCGTIGAASSLGDAEVAVGRAHASDGDKYAIYETTSADLYLEKAKEEQGHAHYGAAETLAEKSLELAEAAAQKSSQQRNGAAPPPLPRATITHQANEAPATSAPPMVGTPTVGAPTNSPPPAPAAAPPLVAPAPAPAAPAPEAPRTPVIMPGGTPGGTP